MSQATRSRWLMNHRDFGKTLLGTAGVLAVPVARCEGGLPLPSAAAPHADSDVVRRGDRADGSRVQSAGGTLVEAGGAPAGLCRWFLGPFWTIQRLIMMRRVDDAIGYHSLLDCPDARCARVARFRAHTAGRGWRIPNRIHASHFGARPRARDGGGGTLGRAARRAGDLAPAGCLPHRHGLRRIPGPARHSAAGRRNRHRGVGAFARHRGDDQAQAAAVRRGGSGCFLRHLSRACARHRAATGAERSPLQLGLRRRHGMPARDRHREWLDSPLARGAGRVAPSRGGVGLAGVFFLWQAMP